MTDDLVLANEVDDHNLGFKVSDALSPEAFMAFSASATERLPFRGVGKTCICVVTSLPWVELDMLQRGLIKSNIDIYQLGYRNDVSASAGTHSGGGNTDVGQFSDAQIAVWRDWGWTTQHRTRSQGFDMDHGHGWPFGCPHLSAGGRSQSTQWKNRQNGLRSRGSISGTWPVLGWKTAMERNIPKLFTPQDIAEEVLNLDGVIKNIFTGNDKNTHVSMHVALEYLAKNQVDIERKVDSILDLLKAQTPPAPSAKK